MHLVSFFQASIMAMIPWQMVTAWSMPTCDANIYGLPFDPDCASAIKRIPYAMERENHDITAPHWFVEPQQMRRPFDYLENKYRPKNIIQLPKIWKYGVYYPIYLL